MKPAWDQAQNILVPGDMSALEKAGLLVVRASDLAKLTKDSEEKEERRAISVSVLMRHVEAVVQEETRVATPRLRELNQSARNALALCCLLARDMGVEWSELAMRYNRRAQNLKRAAKSYRLGLAVHNATYQFWTILDKVKSRAERRSAR